MTDLVDQMFPPINRKWAAEYTDFNYWKTPVPDIPLPDLSPPSPALSARSDTSNQSTLARLRNFSLGGRTLSASRSTLPQTAQEANERAKAERQASHLRQMSSFERLSNAILGPTQSPSRTFGPGSLTPTTIESDSEDEGDDMEKGPKRIRRRSISSMPGSLPGSHSDDDMDFEDEDEEGYDEEYGYEGENEEEAAEEAFDDDLLATGEMANVPFL